MEIKELGQKLNKMYSEAPKGEMVAMIHLFGVKYANEIKKGKFSKYEIAKAANIPVSYAVEINKGVKLSRYVKAI
ncbi:HTH-like domain-containing protein [Maribacter aurantiacus]|uniref:HTH-like domain-containing protein n=1 Tax=Maribacter aurantiacus TaxID=1882343 RepID=A0A5R8M5J9_9FLAO|nr:hypothetical protein [Maribacter aurantiacus]TLF44824.1 hypothetical protein FEK29_08645 [Maribacter aurantiacus]